MLDCRELSLHQNLIYWPSPSTSLEKYLRAIWGVVSQAELLILPQINLNWLFSPCAYFLTPPSNYPIPAGCSPFQLNSDSIQKEHWISQMKSSRRQDCPVPDPQQMSVAISGYHLCLKLNRTLWSPHCYKAPLHTPFLIYRKRFWSSRSFLSSKKQIHTVTN